MGPDLHDGAPDGELVRSKVAAELRNWFERMRAGLVAPAPVTTLLGGTILDVDAQAGWLLIDYLPQASFANPAGTVQGGMLGAMLDDLCAALVDSTLAPGEHVATLNLNVSFLRPARLDKLEGRASLLRRGREVCHVSAELRQGGQLVATAVATCMAVAPRVK